MTITLQDTLAQITRELAVHLPVVLQVPFTSCRASHRTQGSTSSCHALQLLINFHCHWSWSGVVFTSPVTRIHPVFCWTLFALIVKNTHMLSCPFLLFWVLQIKLAPAKYVFYHWTAFQVHTHTRISQMCGHFLCWFCRDLEILSNILS